MIVMDKASREVGLSVATVALILAVYNQMMPDHHTVRLAPGDPQIVHATRRSLTHAAALGVTLGIGVGAMARSAWPILAAVVTVGWMTATYDVAARTEPR